LLRHLELHQPPCFSLQDHHLPFHPAGGKNIGDAESHQVTAAQLAVECQVEKSEITRSARHLEANADAPDVCGLKCEFRASGFAADRRNIEHERSPTVLECYGPC